MSELINLLLVEDNEEDAILIVRELSKAGFEVYMERIQTAQEMKNTLADNNWDAVVSDYNLPSFSAPKALQILRQSGKDLPFIVVSGAIGEETAVEIMRSGAHDYLMKGNLNRLVEVLRREIRDAHGRAESHRADIALKESEEQLRLLFNRSNDAIFTVDKHTGRYLNANKAAETLTGRSLEELLTLTVFDVESDGSKDRLKRISQASESVEFHEISYVQPGGDTRIANLTVLSINDALVFEIAHDISEQIQSENTLKRQAQELEALYQTSVEINTQTDLLPMLQTIIERSASLLRANLGCIYLVKPEGETLELIASHNLPKDFIGKTLRLGEGLSGLVVQTGQTIMVDDYSIWEKQAAIYQNAPYRQALGIPLRVKGQVIGAFNISDDEISGPFSDDEIRLASLFADQAALAIESFRLLSALHRELTERRQAELALRESEERYRSVVTNAPVISFVIDAKGKFTLSEGKGLQKLGMKSGEAVGQSAFELYKHSPEIVESLHAALSGETIHLDITVGGNTYDTHYIPILNEDSKVSHVIGVANDISERKRAEESLRSTQTFLNHVLKTIPLGIIVYNIETSMMEFDNTASMTSNGMNIGEFSKLSLLKRLNMIHPDDRRTVTHFLKDLKSLPDGEVRSIEFRGISRDKVWRWFRYLTFVFERNEKGNIAKLLVVTEDVSSSKKAQQALHRQVEELTVLHKITRAGIQVNTIDELVEQVTEAVGNTFYPDNFGVLFLDETQNRLRAHPSYRGITENVLDNLSLENSISGRVITSGKPRRIADVLHEPNYFKVTANIRSELCVPIKAGEHTMGAINAESKQLDFFSDDDERLLLTIAGQMAIAIERIGLFNSERERRQEAETLRQATAALSTSLDLDQVLASILTSLKQVVPYDSASVFLLEGNRLHITVTDGIKDSNQLSKNSFPADDTLFKEVITRRQPIIIADVQADPRFLNWGGTSYVHGWMSVPLITRSEVIGYITLDSRKEAAYSEEAGSMAQAFANQAAAAIENARLFKGMESSLIEINQAYDSTIVGWSKAMDLRDRETEGHTLRVTDLTMKLAKAMQIDEGQMIHIKRGALLHDIGKMGVPDRILLKPDKLSGEELLIMRRHPKYAHDMLSKIEYLRPALEIPFCHHERWDGKGYPRGLKGEQIPLSARLFAVVDVWDALTSDRPYRPAWTRKEAQNYIMKFSGIYFDPQIVGKFLKIVEDLSEAS